VTLSDKVEQNREVGEDEPMKFRTFANPETSDTGLPSAPRKGRIETAADKISLSAPFWERRVCKNRRKFAVSSGDTTLQPIPCLPGYSQLWIGE